MDDNEMKAILESLKLQDYVEIFEKNKITKEILKELSEDMIREMLPLVGPRAIFLSYWKANFQSIPLRSQNTDTDPPLHKKIKLQSVNNDEPEELVDDIEIETQSVQSKGGPLERQNAFYNAAMFTTETMLPLREILSNYSVGRKLLKEYDREKDLSDKNRNKLCDIVLSDFEDRNTTARFNHEVAHHIAKKILEVFPTEVLATYYVPPIAKKESKHNKSVAARGKLLSMWRNRTYQNKKLYKSESSASSDNLDEQENIENNPEIKASLEWIGKNQAPWELVEMHWRKTFNVRRMNIETSKEKKLFKILDKWQIVKHPSGHILIRIDFEMMKLSDVALTIEIWNNFMENVRKCKSITSKDDTGHELVENLKNKNISNDSKVVVDLMSLPHLLPPKRMVRNKEKYWKPSIANAKESIIKHAFLPGDVTRIREEVKSRNEKLQMPVQPYIIVIGPNLMEINNSYVCIDDVLYNVSSPLEAVDICFKAFHVLQVEYPAASEHLWILLQKGIFHFSTKWDPTIPTIELLIQKVLKVSTTSQESE